ncbi:MAG: DNA polymerase III subunit delta [Bacteroidales bacterium]|nr:DNA polymerase III subunit delta [Bacteroidales bacterium]
MAKQGINVSSQCRELISEIKAGQYKPVYLLMGEEAYYPDLVCQAIIDNCIDEFSKDFNETICYGADVTADQVISAARQFPMMADRVLVVVREAQLMKTLEQLSVYCEEPLESTVLVILMHGASADKRKALYKQALKVGAVVDSQPVRDYEIPAWITSYYDSRGLRIDPDAAALLGESVGSNLSTIVLETDKLLKALPEGTTRITADDIEKNVGVSRQFTVFELNKELSARNATKALKIAAHIGNSARFALPAAVSALYMEFNRILRYGALLQRNPYPSQEDKARALAGVNPYFYRQYDQAVRNYPVPKAMKIISLLCEYDYLGKGGDGSVATDPGELLVELTAKILSA